MKKNLKIALQIDPINKLNIDSDTSLAIAFEAYKRGHELYYYQTKDLYYLNGNVFANIRKLKLFADKKDFYELEPFINSNFDNIDVILMRQDPPFDLNYITYTHLLEFLDNKCLVINNPKSVRNLPEKIFSCKFAKYMPPTLISNNKDNIINFANKYKQIIIKPLYEFGGKDIYKTGINDDNFITIIDMFLDKYNHPFMIQKYLNNVKKGDKRIILINGKIAGAINRVPENGKIISNMVRGGQAKKTKITKIEQEICNLLEPILVENKIYLAGIDIIDDHLTEINVTSPTGFKAINKYSNIKLEEIFWNQIEDIV